jgi:hypothetical protein
MDGPLDPRTRNPDPAKRYRVIVVRRGVDLFIEIWDEVMQMDVVIPFPEVLTVAADLNLEVARLFSEIVARLDHEDGTLPTWEQQISGWQKKGTGTEEQN